jgi:hypothetical protein
MAVMLISIGIAVYYWRERETEIERIESETTAGES